MMFQFLHSWSDTSAMVYHPVVAKSLVFLTFYTGVIIWFLMLEYMYVLPMAMC